MDMRDVHLGTMRQRGVLAIAALLIATAGATVATRSTATAQDDGAAVPPFVQAGMPGPAHTVLETLAGTWRVEKSTFIAGGTAGQPLRGALEAHRTIIAGGRFLQDVTEGEMGGQPYYRMGLLGYSNEDRRYEWVTADGLNANMMIYLGETGAPPAGVGTPIEVTGTFTDQGLVAPGQAVGQRTVFRIEDADHHVVELYFTPPGGEEILADRGVYTRVP
jgi:hypothetical protein